MDYSLNVFCIFHFSLQSSVLSDSGSCNSRGECCYGFEFLNGECVECSIGWFGINCTSPCSDGYFGKHCISKCECQSDQMCDRALGCVDIWTISTTESPGSIAMNTLDFRTMSDSGTSTGKTLTGYTLEIHLLFISGILGLILLCLAIVFGKVYIAFKKRKNNMNTVAIESVPDVQGLDMDLQDINESVSDRANQRVYESVYEEIHEDNEDDVNMECARRGMMLPSPEPNVDENMPEHEYIEIIDVDSTYLEPCNFTTA